MAWTEIFEAWGMADPQDRADHAARLTEDSIHYADPHTGALQGRAAFLAMLDEFTASMPGGGARPRASDGFEGHGRATVDFLRDGQVMMTGQYFARTGSNGKLTQLVGFPGMPEV